jgi:hypothetical protein
VDDTSGRVNSFVINGKVAIYLKHSERRLSPWGFTFTMDQIEELVTLKNKYRQLFIGLICWRDGVVFTLGLDRPSESPPLQNTKSNFLDAEYLVFLVGAVD